MEKSEAIRQTANFLSCVFSDDYNSIAMIVTAEADKNCDALLDMLDSVVDYCNKLKKALEE